MPRKISNNPLFEDTGDTVSDQTFDAEAERKQLGITLPAQTDKPGKGRPRNNNLVRDNSAQAGLPIDWTRASFIVRAELLDKLKDYAYTERITLKDALDMALTQFLSDKKDLLQHK